jgi:dihydropteroate synthase
MPPQVTLPLAGSLSSRSGPATGAQCPRLPRPGRCLIMGMLNVTPDSFSDGGKAFRPERATARGLEMSAMGADIVDVGGESIRPGAERVPLAEEMRRVIRVVRELAAAGVFVSVNTVRARAAEAAVLAGARMINDVSGGLADPAMMKVAADCGVPYVITHCRAHSRVMQSSARYCHVVPEIVSELDSRISAASRAGVARDRLIIDPGLGFGKTPEHNWQILAGLDRFLRLGLPLLLCVSGRSFPGRVLLDQDGERSAPQQDAATAAITALAAAAGVWGVGVHDVRPSLDAAMVAAQLRAHAVRPDATTGGQGIPGQRGAPVPV